MEEHIGVLAGTAFVVVLSMIYVLTQVIERGEPATARIKHHRVRRTFNNDLVFTPNNAMNSKGRLYRVALQVPFGASSHWKYKADILQIPSYLYQRSAHDVLHWGRLAKLLWARSS